MWLFIFEEWCKCTSVPNPHPNPYVFGPPRSASGSVSKRYGSEDPDQHLDPYQNVTDKNAWSSFTSLTDSGDITKGEEMTLELTLDSCSDAIILSRCSNRSGQVREKNYSINDYRSINITNSQTTNKQIKHTTVTKQLLWSLLLSIRNRIPFQITKSLRIRGWILIRLSRRNKGWILTFLPSPTSMFLLLGKPYHHGFLRVGNMEKSINRST